MLNTIKDFFETSSGGIMSKNSKYWFEEEVEKPKYKTRIETVDDINDYLLREHKVSLREDFEFKGKTFETAKIILQSLRSIIKFHVGYICSNPISLTGDSQVVSDMTNIYKKGNFHKRDMEIAKDLLTYGDCFEYLFLDDKDRICSKIIRNKDSYPIYNSDGKYTHFVEFWKDEDTRDDHYVVYYPDKVEIYINHELVDTKVNLSGLPIWYSSLDKSKNDMFGDPFILDLIPVMDSIEQLLSKLDDAVSTLSLNPIGVVTGQRIDSNIPNNITGVVLNLEDNSTFQYASANMDRESIKLELDYLIQMFYSVACVPSVLTGSSNIANVSENSTTMIFYQTDNFCKQFITAMKEGFVTRFEQIRKLLEIKDTTIDDELFDTLDFCFNVNRPVDNKSDMENMKLQYECGAISKQTIIDKSPYTTDVALELERLKQESEEAEKEEPVSEEQEIIVTESKEESNSEDDAA
nr:MAG: portal protein [Bacteriophage sp.]